MFRVVSKGEGAKRDIVMVFHMTGVFDGPFVAAAPKGAVVVNDTGLPFVGYYGKVAPLQTLVDSVVRAVGPFEVGKVYVCGFSEGCGAIRRILRLGGRRPDAVVAADGLHATKPLIPSDVQPLTDFVKAAMREEVVFVASHSGLTYVETYDAKWNPQPYSAVVTVLRHATGWALPKETWGPNAEPHRTATGRCVVYSFAGATKEDHAFQVSHQISSMLAEAVALVSSAKSVTAAIGAGAVAGAIALFFL